MPRLARKDSQSCYYHVIVQGINKEYILGKSEYIEKYLSIIVDKLPESKVVVLAYCIMSNHAHFLIYSEKSEYLGKFMQRVNTAYSRFYNRKNKRVGYVFRDRYYSQDIMTEKQLYNCLRYIHNNPVKAKMSTTMKDCQHSSYNEFLGKRRIITEEAIRLLFGTIDQYKEEFRWIHNESYKYNEEEFMDIKDKTIAEYVKEVEKKYCRRITELTRDKNLLRYIVKQARKETDVTIMELAAMLGLSKSTVGRYLK